MKWYWAQNAEGCWVMEISLGVLPSPKPRLRMHFVRVREVIHMCIFQTNQLVLTWHLFSCNLHVHLSSLPFVNGCFQVLECAHCCLSWLVGNSTHYNLEFRFSARARARTWPRPRADISRHHPGWHLCLFFNFFFYYYYLSWYYFILFIIILCILSF